MWTSLLTTVRRLQQKLARARGKRTARREQQTAWAQWFLLIGPENPTTPWIPDPARLQPILPPPDRFWADPFLWRRDGRWWLFVEEYPRARAIGQISVLPLGDDLQPRGEAQTVLAEDRHLSYPFLFDFGGDLFMVPESAQSRCVDLYQCERFPDRWVRRHSLLTNIEAADATLFAHAGRWWLMCAAHQGRIRMNESLYAFHADSPLSRHWIPHAGNPIVRDFSRGRPAGRILPDAHGRLVRPSQDCVPHYGYGLGLNRIDHLTPEVYREQRIWSGSGPALGGWRGLHHLDRHAGVLVLDAQRLIDDEGYRIAFT
ncbi:hypothetical protein CKO25_02920 [Thiocapsa imhoffii]|uniref:Glucosamine inositolphosphorylceramide transferase 1 N-terminal domain-containing protein n=1 Tax=Thiocapsa imhoffii TaxID=382777 RepID=A0A9X1B867_9GAMM|nr:hypothetical protein [Thiocapsa imhoffii]MBK1643626.1 hypothetical protein [Thiocapsa imhoffii]